jgi:DNA-binding Xre family transcriptional regulator
MMTHAYDKVFLDDAMETLGSAVEYAVLQCNMDGQRFLDLFVASGIASEFEAGNPLFLSGKSGIELAKDIFRRVGERDYEVKDLPYIDYPAEYWVGWILACYQWYTALSFEAIFKVLTYETVSRLYGVLHEADPEKAVETFDALLAKKQEPNLARIRKERGLSQSELAGHSGVSIRSIQLFEQRKANINHAQYNNLKALAGVLRCTVEDLMEYRLDK